MEGKVFKPYPLSAAGLATLPGSSVLSVGEQEEAGGGVSISNRFLFATPRAPFTTGVLSAKASPSHPKPGPKGFPFSLLMDEGII